MGYADKRTVLVVDDDPDLRLVTAEMLVENGYHTIAADGASEAIDLLSRHDVDVLLTDIHMPGLSGFALAEQAKRLKPDLLVIFTTGFIPQSMWDQRRSGAVLRKPYSGRQLFAEITRLTGVN
jgi:CheY-like chemotaxis protein